MLLRWHPKPRFMFALASVCLGAGCAHFESKPLAPERSAAALESRSLDDPELRRFLEKQMGHACPAWPLPAWDFTNLVVAAFFYNPDLDLARASWGVALAARRTAGERPNPTVGVAPAFDTTTAIPSPWLVTATFDIPIETAGKRGYRLAQAAALSEAARLNVASVALDVRSRVRQRLLELANSRVMRRLLGGQAEIQAENLRLLQGQFDAGALSGFDLTQARIAADTARLALHDAEAQSVEALGQLAEAVGVPLPVLEAATLSFPGLETLPEEIPAEAARRQALLNRADILSAVAAYAAAQSALQLEIAKQYPDVHLNPGYEFNQGDNQWALGATVTLPILNHNQGAVGEAEARRQESAAAFKALQARVIAEVGRAVAAYRVALKKAVTADSLRTSLERQEQAALSLLGAGEIARTDLLALQLQLSAAGVARADALAKAQMARGQLEDALQAPLGFAPAAWQEAPHRAGEAR